MKAEGVVKVSTKGQIVIPKDVRTQFGIVPGKKLLVAVEGNEILIKKMEELSLGELSKKLTKELGANLIVGKNINALVVEEFELRPLGRVKVGDLPQPLEIFELCGAIAVPTGVSV